MENIWWGASVSDWKQTENCNIPYMAPRNFGACVGPPWEKQSVRVRILSQHPPQSTAAFPGTGRGVVPQVGTLVLLRDLQFIMPTSALWVLWAILTHEPGAAGNCSRQMGRQLLWYMSYAAATPLGLSSTFCPAKALRKPLFISHTHAIDFF